MGFLKDLSNWSKRNKQKKEARKQAVNQNPTDEQLKDNKKGKLAYLWTFISIVVYGLGFGLVYGAWQTNIAVGIMALILSLSLTPIVHAKAINLAKDQRRINGKGLLALLLASLLPLIVLAGGFFFFAIGDIFNICI